MPDLKSALSGLGTVLTGAAMGSQGRGAEFAQSLEQDRQRKQLEQDQTYAIGGRIMLNAINDGNWDVAQDFLHNAIREGGKEDQNLLSLATMFRNGEKDKIKNVLGTNDQQYTLKGILPEMAQPREKKFLKAENGRATFLNPDNTVSEEAIKGTLDQSGEGDLKFSDQRGVINDIEKLTREASSVKDAASALDKLSEMKSRTDQLAAIFSFMKALDPASVVRDEEQKQVVGTGGVAESFKGYINNLMGEGRLDPKVFDDMVTTAKNLANQKIENTSKRAGVVIDAFGNKLGNKARKRLMDIVPGSFEMLPAPKDEVNSGAVDRTPATLTTLDEVGQGTNIPQQMQQNTVNWSDM